jgi:TRAP-type C4-dicarboxylate transport system substrate-binding protein
VNETDHAVFLTVLLANKPFFDSLPPEDRALIQDSAVQAMQAEREDSIALAAHNRSLLQADGVTITTLTPNERAGMQTASESVYTKYQDVFGENLIDSIRATQQ